MTNQNDPWGQYAREGFANLEKYRAAVDKAWFQQGDFGIQLVLRQAVDFVEAPVEQAGVKQTMLFYSMGSKADFQLAGEPVYNDKNDIVGYTDIWSPSAQAKGEEPGIVKTTKFWMLAERVLQIGAARMIQERGKPTSSQIWVGFHADWVLEDITTYKNLDDQKITLPIALASVMAASAPVGAPVVQNGYAAPSPPTSMPPPQMAAPAPMAAPVPQASVPAPAPAPTPAPTPVLAAAPQQQSPVFNYESIEAAGWCKYIASIVRDKNIDDAQATIQHDPSTSGQSDVMNATFNGHLLGWMTERGWLIADPSGEYKLGPLNT